MSSTMIRAPIDGPGSHHVHVTREARGKSLPKDLMIIRVKYFTVEEKNDTCGSCHAKRQL